MILGQLPRSHNISRVSNVANFSTAHYNRLFDNMRLKPRPQVQYTVEHYFCQPMRMLYANFDWLGGELPADWLAGGLTAGGGIGGWYSSLVGFGCTKRRQMFFSSF